MTNKAFTFFEHTADVGMKAYGKTLEELFIHTAQGMVSLLVEDGTMGTDQTHPIQLSAESTDRLLVAWLKEVLFWFHTDRFLPGQYQLNVTDTELRGTVDGERFDPAKHRPGTEIKGITYHQFQLTQRGGRWEAQVIFDV